MLLLLRFYSSASRTLQLLLFYTVWPKHLSRTASNESIKLNIALNVSTISSLLLLSMPSTVLLSEYSVIDPVFGAETLASSDVGKFTIVLAADS